MSRFKTLTVAMLVSCFVAACGGGSDSVQAGSSDNGGVITAEPGWEIIKPTNSKGSFQLPKPVKHNSQDGVETFGGAKQGNVQIWVTCYYRGGVQIGKDDADALAIFEKQRIDMQKARLLEKGFNPQMSYEKDLAVEDGLGQQIRMSLGDQFILNRFYINANNLYHVKIDNGDESSPPVQKFIESFTP